MFAIEILALPGIKFLEGGGDFRIAVLKKKAGSGTILVFALGAILCRYATELAHSLISDKSLSGVLCAQALERLRYCKLRRSLKARVEDSGLWMP
ncbi:hypothetical protein AVEN_240315-1 [Araneus ventricosus]|uniref:Uncharacterized protein n=1 Tax=Araneus ventricosus TaxID=182803 RepID=A0A4Y2FHL9_ARAVE|nr:hypothetical protein AVEN_240315-1 [Araneus ventricosus]